MNWILEIAREILLTAGTAVLFSVAAWLGRLMGKCWKEKFTDESSKSIAKTCVEAVEMIYRESGGAEKMDHAIRFASQMMEEKGISLPPDRLRLLLEAALAEWK